MFSPAGFTSLDLASIFGSASHARVKITFYRDYQSMFSLFFSIGQSVKQD